MSKELGEQLTENKEKEPISQKEFFDGCIGCSSLGCLPFTVIFLVFIFKVF